jgi:adhesin transport system outer membrane protein
VLNTSESTALQAIQSYLDVLMREQMVKLAEDNLHNHERVFDQIRLRTAQGRPPGRLRSGGSPPGAGAEQSLTEQTNLEDSRANYQSVTGKDADTLVMPGKITVPASLEAARKVMLENNALLKQADADVEATAV